MGGEVRKTQEKAESKARWPKALLFVFLLGIVSLLADMANEGSRSIIGPYLALLGASAVAVSLVAGLSELIGYTLRVPFGWLADRTGRYWTMTFIGYGINLVAVPALALAGDWTMAVGLIVVEKIGRAIRGPARDAMLSHAGAEIGRGWAYGVQEALSSVGGMLGPMMVVLVLLLKGSYPLGLALLTLPALAAVMVLIMAYRLNPHPRDMEGACTLTEVARPLPTTYWWFVAAGALIAAGYVDFPLVSFHVSSATSLDGELVPLLYALAMAADALSALAFGRLYDKHGMGVLLLAGAVVPLFIPLVFSSDPNWIIVGMVLYGVGFGAQESIMRAIVADIVPHCRRGAAFGYYNAIFGISWFAGSLAIGLLYGASLPAMMIFSMVMMWSALPVLWIIMKTRKGLANAEAP